MNDIRPDSVEAVHQCVNRALADQTPLHVHGCRTKARLGRRLEGGTPLNLSGLDELIDYDPNELILVARPGMRLQTAEELLAGKNQQFAFEPPHWGAAATIGGTVACNLSGPRRFKAGGLRDHLLGFEMIDGYGKRVRSGGRVVKNVTGYDLPKLLSGSFGTLGILTEVCLRIQPCPQTQQTLVIHGQDAAAALHWLLSAAALPCEITGLAYQPAEDPESARTLARIEGPAPAVASQLIGLRQTTAADTSILDEIESADLWRRWRELEPFQPRPDEQLWRFSLPPASAVQLLEDLKPHDLCRYGLDWGGGLIWGLFPIEVSSAELHHAVSQHQGTAWRFATSSEDPNHEAFTPLSPGLARMTQMLKEAFDPRGIFNPGKIL